VRDTNQCEPYCPFQLNIPTSQLESTYVTAVWDVTRDWGWPIEVPSTAFVREDT
jgi:hypothetical protein